MKSEDERGESTMRGVKNFSLFTFNFSLNLFQDMLDRKQLLNIPV